MLFDGINAKIKDRRVDQLLMKSGYVKYEIFYSPIGAWLSYLGMFAMINIPLCYYLFYYWYYLVSYLFFGYLLAAYFNNSIVITEEKLLIINPNFPFRNFVEYDLKAIKEAYIDKNKWLYLLFVFVMGTNYIEIKIGGKVQRYYCACLEEDYYDENVTKKTLDDLVNVLREKKIKVIFKI